MKTSLIFFFLTTIVLPFWLVAQTGIHKNSIQPTPVVKLSQPIIFDGIPDEKAWDEVPALPMTTLIPAFGKEPAESSIIKIAYDDEYFYVSGILNYNDPTNIRAIGKKRDYGDRSTCRFGFLLDTFNDRENAVVFVTNPNGIRVDGAIKNDCENEGNDYNSSWNTFWDVKTTLTDQGWTAEFRIPFSSLRFQVNDDKTLMGVLITRWSPALPELSNYPVSSPRLSSPYYRPSLSSVIEFQGLQPAKPIYITPYIVSGISQINRLNDAGTAYGLDSDLTFDIGGDLKFSIANNLTLDLTVNTDFAQVEADDQKINLSRDVWSYPQLVVRVRVPDHDAAVRILRTRIFADLIRVHPRLQSISDHPRSNKRLRHKTMTYRY